MLLKKKKYKITIFTKLVKHQKEKNRNSNKLAHIKGQDQGGYLMMKLLIKEIRTRGNLSRQLNEN